MSLLKNIGKVSFSTGLLLLSVIAKADGPPLPSSTNNPFVVIMLIIIGVLALAIILLANVVLGAAQIPPETTDPAPRDAPDNKPGLGLPAGIAPVAVATESASSTVNGVSDTAFYLLTGVVFLEMLILMALLYNLQLLLSIHKKTKLAAAKDLQPAPPRLSWWDRMNRLKPLEQEPDLDLGHDYDGIRELDNRLPPWWLYGFYCTILFAGVYLWRYHVSHSAPLSGEEYRISVAEAEVRKVEYLKKAANNIDENTVKQLTTPEDLAAGKTVFETTCFACHGKSGEGGVGPNLTDEYWLHGGSIQDVFKTIKYGWPDKGMKSWKDDYSPSQIAQIASFVKSLGGTHPVNPKAPQGVIYK